MMRLKQIFGPSAPISEARVWRMVYCKEFYIYGLAFAGIAALWHPYERLHALDAWAQVAFWVISYGVFYWMFTLIHLALLRITLWCGGTTVYETLVMFLTTFALMPFTGLFLAILGAPVDSLWQLALVHLFCFALFEIGAFGYLAYADKVLFPEVYATPTTADSPNGLQEVFLRGTDLPVVQVEMICANDEGCEVFGNGKTFILRRRLSPVLAELPVDFGFQIHRSIWVSRRLATANIRDGRNIFVTLSNGKRLAVARSRQREFLNWLKLWSSSPL